MGDQEAGLRGFAGAVETFEGDEAAAGGHDDLLFGVLV
jgi:hypothetical protein